MTRYLIDAPTLLLHLVAEGIPDRFIRARDRRYRFPGCRRRVPLGGELDHTVPYPDAATAADSLTGFLRVPSPRQAPVAGWVARPRR